MLIGLRNCYIYQGKTLQIVKLHIFIIDIKSYFNKTDNPKGKNYKKG